MMDQSKQVLTEDPGTIPPGPGGDATQHDTTHDKRGGEEGAEGTEAQQDAGKREGGEKKELDKSDEIREEREEAAGAALQDERKDDRDAARESSSHALLDKDLYSLSRPERSTLYEAGVKLQTDGQMEEALKCLLGAITGLTESSTFHQLPQCLHGIADIYFEKNEYEKAVYFIQAEKMYYETALIDIVNVQKLTDTPTERSKESGEITKETPDEVPVEEPKPDDPRDNLSPDAKKGQEFDNLAKLCLKEGKLQLALEYCGKATKMYQAVYGEDHPSTVAALDLFTVIYADVGKKLYSDAMQKFEEEEEVLKAEKGDDPGTDLGHRGQGKDAESSEQTTHQGELEPTSLDEQDDWVMTCLLMLIFFLGTVFVAILISSIYCYNNSRAGYCAQTRGDINYWYMYARHVIHDIRKSFKWLG